MSEKRRGGRHNKGKEATLDMLSEGLSTQEIRDKLASRQERGKMRKEKGSISEQKVEDIIGFMHLVKEVSMSKKDKKGKDLSVVLYKKKCVSHFKRKFVISHVWIEVKSSDEGINFFRSSYGDSEEEINNNLARKRFVVLNGNHEQEKIRNSFRQQIDFIDLYHQKHNKA